MKVNVLYPISFFLPMIYAHIPCTENVIPTVTLPNLVDTYTSTLISTPIIKLPLLSVSSSKTTKTPLITVSSLVSITSKTSTQTTPISTSTSTSTSTSSTSSILITTIEPIETPPPSTIPSPPIPSPPVQRIEEYIFKGDDIVNILKKHNDERLLNNVTNISWNTNLKDSSQIWSNNLASRDCILEHKLFSSAQNLYAGYGWIEPNLPNAMQAWLDEKSLLNQPNITFEEIGHYLIMISANYNDVGCASSINIDKKCFVVTCNYS